MEVAVTPTTILIRDSKTPETRQVSLSSTAWNLFLAYVAGNAPRFTSR
ncbi:DUF397 domain-containing protein [Streptomyces sp. CRN 30]